MCMTNPAVIQGKNSICMFVFLSVEREVTYAFFSNMFVIVSNNQVMLKNDLDK